MNDNTPTLKRIEAELAKAIQNAIDYLDAPSEDAYAEECFRTIRNEQWHELQALRSKIATVLEQGGSPALTSQELDLAADVVDCADVLRTRDEKSQTASIQSIAIVAGLGVTVLGILSFLR